MKYVLLFCGTEEDAAAFAALSPEALGARYEEVRAWFAEPMSASHSRRPKTVST